MKRLVIAIILVLLIFLLMITKSLYVDWGELFIIIGALSLASVIYLKNKIGTDNLIVTPALIGFIFCWVFGVADLIVDHYLYFLPNGDEDGVPLLLGFKIEEFRDDLFFGSIISMFIVLAVTFVLKKVFSFASAKTM